MKKGKNDERHLNSGRLSGSTASDPVPFALSVRFVLSSPCLFPPLSFSVNFGVDSQLLQFAFEAFLIVQRMK
ncbi:MAG TPA: hypothetical protein VFB82_24000, partial [Blastocatellia bacterium]|nr:hypothetical protein [Blastocatellia bacterium]